MRLESIVLKGFKSFAERTEIKVLPGITAIVGPNGCGKCVSGDTPVVLADGRPVPIRALVETSLKQAGTVRHLDDGVVASGAQDIVEVLSLNPATLRLERRPVEAFIKRTAPPFLLRVRTRSGREIVTTHYHPFFGLEQGQLKALTADTLVEGVRVAVPRCLPVKAQPADPLGETVLRAFALADRIYLPFSAALQEWLETARRRVGGWRQLAEVAGVPQHWLSNVKNAQAINVAAVGRIARIVSPLFAPVEALKSAKGTVRLPPEFDGRLARFLGYLIAEGQTTRSNQVWFVNSDPAVVADYSRLASELFGVRPRNLRYKTGVVDTLIFSRALCVLLDRVFDFKFKGRSAEKAVPPQVWSAPDDVVAEFLSGLFEGDAYIHPTTDPAGKVMPYLEYVTASRQLAEGVATLLLRLGIVALIRPEIRYAANTSARRRRMYYAVYVYGVQQLQRLIRHIRFVGSKQERLDDVLRLDLCSNPNLDVVPGITALVRAAVTTGGLRVKPFRSSNPKLAAYVDRRCEASRSGLREVVDLVERHGATPSVAGPLLGQLRVLANSDIYWDEVVAVERLTPPDEWVYDLTVTDTHNFVAGSFIVHNSNVSESVRWALGEQSAKSLRGTRMEDLIFHGSASRKPLGLAEVELTFSNDGALAVPWSEVSVSRRLYRDGESEYLLNKSACRLRDVVDLLAGTGANAKAYSVMDQEKLNHVLTAKPYERRIFVEEAAGIARYKQQRHETQAKLDAARQNLLRVRDVMDEVKRQLGSLERQAKKAQQYKAWQTERQSLARSLLAADYAALESEHSRLAADLSDLRAREQEGRTHLASLGATEARQREAIQEMGYRLTDIRQDLQKVRGEFARLLERRDQMTVQIQESTEEERRLLNELTTTAERTRGLAVERDDKQRALRDVEATAAARTVAAEGRQRALDALRGEIGAQRDRLEALRLIQVRMAAERTDLTRATGELRERQTQLERRAARLAQELTDASRAVTAVAAERAAAEGERERAMMALDALAGALRRLQEQRAERAGRLAAAQERLAEIRVALAAAHSSFEALEQLERAREGYGAGVRAVFREEGAPTLPGVVGTVADLLEVPAGLDAAIEAVLGERLQWVVVERFEHAREAVAFLGAERVGAATFVPLETLPAPSRLPGDENAGQAKSSAETAGDGNPGDGNDVRWMADTVRADSAALLHYLLGRVAVVNHLDTAEALWRRNGVLATYVTPAGEVLSPTGRLRGGGTAAEESAIAARSLLHRKRALRELEERIRDLTGSLPATQAAAGALEAELSHLRDREAELGHAIQADEAARLASEKDAQQAQREHDRLARHLETVELELSQVMAERAETDSTLGELLGRIARAGDAEDAHERSLLTLRAAVDSAQERETALASEVTGIRVEAGADAERVDSLRREIDHLAILQQELAQRLAHAQARRQQIGGRAEWLAVERERSEALAREVVGDRDRLEGTEREVAEQYERLVEALREVEVQMRAAQTEVTRLMGSAHDIELRATERRVRAEELAQEAWRRFSIEQQALLDLHEPAADLTGLRERRGELDAKLEAMGAVNLVADDEYRELDERLSFLRAQHDDLVASVKDLEKALRGMTRTAHERFRQAFEAINAQFGLIFERLFEGGRAQLSLVEPEEGDDPLETGIELLAQPRGKRLQAVTLMSGGERALTGLALLFAIFYFRPSPFCVLDEVDAPLDDANIHRFLRVLRELCSQTQFLVITHNRKTMEAADALYGVTMEEPGLSKLVSVNLG